MADDMTSVPTAGFQKVPLPSLNFVPPTEVTLCSAPGRSTASPCVDAVVTGPFGELLKSQSAAPVSPVGASTVIPSAFACFISDCKELIAPAGKLASQSP